eukprot:m.1407309 g.1407309  ORF g.1407309 m.1407309 type:complete len:160 (-) comp25016_c0_seq11:63-542(-)
MHCLVDDLTSVFKPLEVKEQLLAIGAILGSGQFGDVVAAELSDGGHGSAYTTRAVALKRLKQDMRATRNGGVEDSEYLLARATLMAEGALLAQLRHANIIGLIGVVSKNQQAMLVMEMCAFGSLQSLLVVRIEYTKTLATVDTACIEHPSCPPPVRIQM